MSKKKKNGGAWKYVLLIAVIAFLALFARALIVNIF